MRYSRIEQYEDVRYEHTHRIEQCEDARYEYTDRAV
jgi:hypothetical protein